MDDPSFGGVQYQIRGQGQGRGRGQRCRARGAEGIFLLEKGRVIWRG